MNRRVGVLMAFALGAAGCAVRSRPPALAPVAPRVLAERVGIAWYYARSLDGRLTASGTRFNGALMIAAHPSYPFGTIVRVTNLENGRSVQTRIVDRGPAPERATAGVIIDLSQAAADALGFLEAGRARVRLEVLRWGP